MINWNEQRRIKKTRRNIAAVILLFLLLGGLGAAYVVSALQPVQAASKVKKEVTIPKGTSTSGIGQLLEKQGIIKDGSVFQYYVKANYRKGLQAGTYLLSPSMSAREVAEQLVEGRVYRPVRYKLVIKEGMQLTEIADSIAAEFKLNKDEVLQQFNDKGFLQQIQTKYPKLLTDKMMQAGIRYPLEGYLFPATYSYHEKAYTLQQIIDPMLEKTNTFIVRNEELMKQRGLDVHQLLTMGSLIEEEATALTDRQKIASVFYNRIQANMPLQTDPTVLYALGKHKDRVLYADLQVDSPYNTYIIKGLPIGPIANAGEPSLQAALEPAQTDFFYFLAAPSGEVFFSKTLEEHNALKEKYITGQQS